MKSGGSRQKKTRHLPTRRRSSPGRSLRDFTSPWPVAAKRTRGRPYPSPDHANQARHPPPPPGGKTSRPQPPPSSRCFLPGGVPPPPPGPTGPTRPPTSTTFIFPLPQLNKKEKATPTPNSPLRAPRVEGTLVDFSAVPAYSRPVFKKPLSNRACSFPAHGLTMIFLVWLAPGTSRSLAVDTDPYLQTVHGTTSPLDPPAARRAGPSSA